MFNKIRQFSKNALIRESLIYGLTNALYSGLPIFILPLIVNVLSPEDYGFVEFYRNFTLILIPLLGLSTVQSVIRFYYDLEEMEFKVFVSNIVFLHFFMSFIGILMLLSISLFIDSIYLWLIGFSIVHFLFSQITETLLCIYRAEKTPKKYLMLRLGVVLIDLLLLGVFLIFSISFDWSYRVYPNVISTTIVGMAALFILFKNRYFNKVDRKLLKMAVLFGVPVILHMISGYILNIGDRFFILYFLSREDLGNYAVMYQLGTMVNFLFTSFNLAWVPTFFEMMKAGNTKRIKKVKLIIYTGILVFSALILLFVYFIKGYISFFNKYEIDMGIVSLVSVSYIFFSMYRFESNYFFFFKNTKRLSIITLGAAIITIVLNLILIPIMKLYGCALTTLIASFFMFIVTTIRTKSNENNIEKI